MSQPIVDQPTDSKHTLIDIINTEQIRETHPPKEVRIML